MRNIYPVLFLSIFFSIQVTAQNTQYFDAPFGGGGGFIPGWYIPNLDPINKELKTIGAPELSSSGLFTTGGGGFIYLGIIPNVRFGGLGFGGSKSEDGRISLQGNNYNFETTYSLSGGGLTVEYTLPFVRNIGVSVGALIGGGSVKIETFRNNNPFSWDELLNENSTENISRTLKNNFWILAPTLNIDIPFYRFLSFRLGAGYQFTLGEDWRVENDKNISGVPSDLNGRSFFIQSGIFIGFFSY